MFEQQIYDRDQQTVRRLLLRHKRRLQREYSTKSREARRIRKSSRPNSNTEKAHVVDYDNSDKRFTRKISAVMPEETFEHWICQKKLNKHVERHIVQASVDRATVKKSRHNDLESTELERALRSDSESSEDENDLIDENEEHGEDDPDFKGSGGITKMHLDLIKNDIKEGKLFTNDVATRVILQKQGLEILPRQTRALRHRDRKVEQLSTNSSTLTRQLTTVLDLLHINILRKKWELAYKCFLAVVHFQKFDLRSVWYLGLEVLTRLGEQRFLEAHPDASEHELRTYGALNDVPMTITKDEQFLRWLESTYRPKRGYSSKAIYREFAYRAGTKDTPSMYVTTLIWTMVMKQRFDEALEKLDELLMTKPYLDDGTYHFLKSLSYQVQASGLVREAEIDKFRVQDLLDKAERSYVDAKTHGVEYPEKLFAVELKMIRASIEEDNNDEQDSSDEDEQKFMDASEYMDIDQYSDNDASNDYTAKAELSDQERSGPNDAQDPGFGYSDADFFKIRSLISK
ncbi:CYFA0S04e03664g1_1 [Cyberlindnera fabianii]|uniref:CYFA0S04e03664g1_1 n=1 Tax=Cyberlindnera fabianii TaxID=36022 RepID=A0A061AZD4_CYBFA|nr:CYFA0S04e03664g1_1 [Cyberlindnera fabianii]